MTLCTFSLLVIAQARYTLFHLARSLKQAISNTQSHIQATYRNTRTEREREILRVAVHQLRYSARQEVSRSPLGVRNPAARRAVRARRRCGSVLGAWMPASCAALSPPPPLLPLPPPLPLCAVLLPQALALWHFIFPFLVLLIMATNSSPNLTLPKASRAELGVQGAGASANRACQPCRARKVRCDGESPCSRCKKTGSECFVPASRRVGRPRPSSKALQVVEAPKNHHHNHNHHLLLPGISPPPSLSLCPCSFSFSFSFGLVGFGLCTWQR